MAAFHEEMVMTTIAYQFARLYTIKNPTTFSAKCKYKNQTKDYFQKKIKQHTSYVFACAVASSMSAIAEPQGGQVISGNVQIQQTGSPGQITTHVLQNSSQALLNWKSFNVKQGETVNFVQPSKDALVVNRIDDTAGSSILGHINANGQVWLINPNGVIFGKDAQINVGGLIASTLTNMDMKLGLSTSQTEQMFSGNSKASVVNFGHINAAEGGYVALLGHSVSNLGQINAAQGSVVMGAGSHMSLRFAGSRLVSIQVNQHQLDAMASNGGLLQADGGQVILTAGARDSVLASAVNNTGVIQARTVQKAEGKIILLAGMKAGKLMVAGSLDASAPEQGNGGSIETSAANVNFGNGLQVSTLAPQGETGEWKIDPTDFVISRGNDAMTGSGISGAALSNLLANSNITIETNNLTGSQAGDILVNAPISWSSPYQLNLKAYRHIYINDVITSMHANGKLHLAVGLGDASANINGVQARYWVNAPVNLKSGWNFSTQTGSGGGLKSYYVITALGASSSKTGTDLQGIDEGVNPQSNSAVQNRNYVLGADIDASATKTWNNGKGFRSLFQTNLTTDEISYQGTFDGLGHVISGLTINRPDTGVLSFMSVLGRNGVIQNLGMKNVNYIANNTGGIVFRNFGLVRNSFVDGGSIIAGDAFKNRSNYIGGLVGHNQGQIIDSYTNVTVAMPDNLSSYISTGSFTYKIGGLVGVNSNTITNSYAAGKVYASSKIVTFADGTSGYMIVAGGLVGLNTKDDIYSQVGKVTNSFWNSQAYTNSELPPAGMRSATQGVAQIEPTTSKFVQVNSLKAQQLKTAANFKQWDTNNAWLIYDGNTRPLLRAFMTPLHISASATGEKAYDGNTNFSTWQVDTPAKLDKFIAGQTSMVLDSPDAGYRQAILTGQYSDQFGYQIVYDFSANNVWVQKGTLTLSAQPSSFYIGQSIDGLKGAVSGFVAGESMQNAVTGELTWTTKAKNALTPGQYAIEGTGISAKNYNIVQAAGNSTALNLKAIAPAPLLEKAVALGLKPQGMPSALNEPPKNSAPSRLENDAEPVAFLSNDTVASSKGSGFIELCLPKPPSMQSVSNVVCIKTKQR
jgi:filamentous hemagglutinin family protein